ncbi:RNA polymerase sigma factor [Marinomonas balearica]|uniref:RNA polymerase sigma-70 factor (ECF subfamily) n=1 Tax=Marinomonas balearica TaxID=491947 RepID=A0A4R6M644_9GAMM|nr:sigma-70 family RNA polymerase sigma factor [Marinomonas balearica]TDO96734.1 RNA polymerase sigma-70 factor (ECF subfamily) [Marinomonas balearica]
MTNKSTKVQRSIDVLYREESPKMLASLLRIFGHHNIDLVEDMLQEAFHTALITWSTSDIPNNPSAWLIQTARNRAIDVIRTQKNRLRLSEQYAELLESEWTAALSVDEAFHEPYFQDEQLRMVFLCCATDMKLQNLLPFILKSLCGLSVHAIAKALFLPEETVKKRLTRTKEQFKQLPWSLPDNDVYESVIERVHLVLYLLFNEGFHSTDDQTPIRKAFCQEAIALLKLLVEHPKLGNKETVSLYALMHFHIARIDTRLDESNQLIPLNLQDRNLWNKGYINAGEFLLNTASNGADLKLSRFYLEALIASEHCRAETFKETDWQKIVHWYRELVDLTGSEVAKINLAVSLGYAGFSEQAIQTVAALESSPLLSKSHMLDATLAHLYALNGDKEKAFAHAKASCDKGGTRAEQALMLHQIEDLLSQSS